MSVVLKRVLSMSLLSFMVSLMIEVVKSFSWGDLKIQIERFVKVCNLYSELRNSET